MTSPPHNVKCSMCGEYIFVFLCAYTVQRFTFCTFTQAKINRFIQVQTHTARSTFVFLSDAGWFKPSYGVRRGGQLIFVYGFSQHRFWVTVRLKTKTWVGDSSSMLLVMIYYLLKWSTVKMDRVITYCAFLWCSEREKTKQNTCDSRGPS